MADIKWHRTPAKEASPPAVGSTSDPGVDEDYGYPNTVGALIIEGPFNYTNGPAVWPDGGGYGASSSSLRAATGTTPTARRSLTAALSSHWIAPPTHFFWGYFFLRREISW